MAVTLEEVKEYLRVEGPEEDGLIQGLMGAAEEYIQAGVGSYDRESERAKILTKIVVQNLYDNRTYTEAQAEQIKHLVRSFMLQLRLEADSDGST